MTDQETITWFVGIVATLGGLYIAYRKLVSVAEQSAHTAATANHVADLEAQSKFRDDLMEQVSDMRRRISIQDTEIIELREQVLSLSTRAERLDHFITLLIVTLDNIADRYPETADYIKEQKQVFFERAEGLRSGI